MIAGILLCCSTLLRQSFSRNLELTAIASLDRQRALGSSVGWVATPAQLLYATNSCAKSDMKTSENDCTRIRS